MGGKNVAWHRVREADLAMVLRAGLGKGTNLWDKRKNHLIASSTYSQSSH